MKKVVGIAAIAILSIATSCKKESSENVKSTEVKSELPEVKLSDEEIAQDSKIIQPNAQDSVKVIAKTTEMTFDKLMHDFGVIKQGAKVEYAFKFKNTGSNDLIITNAKGSCGCTVPEYPKEAIKPGESGKIKVVFDSSNKSGKQTKNVSIFANTKTGSEKLTISSTIVVE